MKKISLGLSSALLFFSMIGNLRADPPVISANGFSCVKSQALVTCQGQFPGAPGLFSASGNFGVQMTYESQGSQRTRSIFDSTTGCLMRISLDVFGNPQQAFVKNVSGSTQSFPLPLQQMAAYQFCKS